VKKLLEGIVEFRKNIRPGYSEQFARLALGQSPDTLFMACSDSRVVPNLFASTNPGDLFVIRNVGNMIAPAGALGHSVADESEVAALEFALMNLKVQNIIVCGHSECGAIQAIYNGRDKVELPHFRSWITHASRALDLMETHPLRTDDLAPHNRLSQINVLLQLEHLKSYPVVRERLERKDIQLHGWWFDIGKAEVSAYEQTQNRFVPIDETQAESILARLNS
jgi:carbonic anhydrase